jgi:hypothetical protein
MKPSERLADTEARLLNSTFQAVHNMTQNELRWLIDRVKELTEALEVLYDTNAIKQPYDEIARKALESTVEESD